MIKLASGVRGILGFGVLSGIGDTTDKFKGIRLGSSE